MIGILLVTHQPLGNAFSQVLAHIFGQCPPQIDVVDVMADESLEAAQQRVLDKIPILNSGQGVVIMTDIAGATPSNCSLKNLPDIPLACLSGTNLPMLLRAIHYRNESLEKMIPAVLEGGHRGLVQLR